MNKKLILKQLFEKESSTYTYILYDHKTLDAILIDPVLETYERDLKYIQELRLKVKYILETHIHADHITSAYKLKKDLNAKVCVSQEAKAKGVDIEIYDGHVFEFGEFQIKAIATPGHTDSCTTYICEDKVFTGDALLIRGCGRTDFQGGCSKKLFQSVRTKIFDLPDDYIIYPAHDYNGFTSSSVIEEKQFNPRLSIDISEESFIKIMSELNLDQPKKIKVAVPANVNQGEIV